MTKFTFIVMPWEIERTAIAETERQAHKAVWQSLTDEQRDNCECLDCVDQVAA